MLEESKGVAAFITTPRGNNHAKAMFDMAKAHPRWFAELSNVEQTGALTQEQLDEALAEYQALYGLDFGRAYFEQEYLCSFSGAMVGAYFGAEVARAEREGRMLPVPIDHSLPVHTVWDLGKAVNNPIWCFQVVDGWLRIVDFYIPEEDDLEAWVAWLNEQGYRGTDYVPHDIVATEWGARHGRLERLVALGRKPWRISKVSVADGLQAGRTAINGARNKSGGYTSRPCIFHQSENADDERSVRVAHGLDGLKAYRREWDDEFKTFRANPVKDWAEHIGSAWRYLGLAWREEYARPQEPQRPNVDTYLLDLPEEPRDGYRIQLRR
jgi:hypothetical protein